MSLLFVQMILILLCTVIFKITPAQIMSPTEENTEENEKCFKELL